MNIRWAQDQDLDEICSWWTGRGKSPLKEGLCPNIAVSEIEGRLVSAAILHLDRNGILSFIAYMCANPVASKDERDQGLEAVMEFLEKQAQNEGYGIFGCFTDSPPVAERLIKNQFKKTDSGMTLFIKRID